MSSLGIARATRSISLKVSGSLTTHRHAGSQFRANLGKPGAHLDGEARVSVEEQSAEALVHHGPEFDTHVDHGTSYDDYELPNARLIIDRAFSPVPKRIMDGSEPGDSVAAAVLSGAPLNLQARTVR